jgi:hypothetical protein
MKSDVKPVVTSSTSAVFLQVQQDFVDLWFKVLQVLAQQLLMV